METAGVDGVYLRYNPQWAEALPMPELVGIIAHETAHCAFGHPWRRGNRDFARWNKACDRAINARLRLQGIPLPAGGLYPEVGAEDLSAEEFYAREAEANPQGGPDSADGQGGPGKPGQDFGGCGNVADAPTEADADGKSQPSAEDWKIAVTQAINQADKAGTLPAGMKRSIADGLRARVDWRAMLREFLQRSARNDYSWSRPSARFAAAGIIMPSLLSEELPEIAVAVDTSGSITSETVNAFLAEIESILADLHGTVRLIACDAEAQLVGTFSAADIPLPRELPGGGGTDFRPAFDAVAEDPPAAFVYLTDLEGRFPDAEPEFPVLWIATTGHAVPFGTVARYHDFEA